MKIQDMDSPNPGKSVSQSEVISFLNTQPLGVLSTLGISGHPQAATVAFSQTNSLELIIGTSRDSRKSLNMQRDPRVAFTVTDPDERYTVQFEGLAQLLSDESFETFADKHFAKLPASAPFRHLKGQCYFLLQPLSVRFTDCNPHPWVTTEFVYNGS